MQAPKSGTITLPLPCTLPACYQEPTFFRKLKVLAMTIKNHFISILALMVIFIMQYDGASSSSHPNIVNSPSLAPYKDVIGGPAPAANAPTPPSSPPYCVYPPPSKPTLPAPLPPVASPPGASPPAAPPSIAPPGGIPPPPPRTFLPPVAFPAPPSGQTRPAGMWCVANPTVASAIVQTAMDYACGSGADCGMAAPGGPCYLPDTLMAHASYAFNSYWQRTKVAGGTCDFAGAAMLVTKDPTEIKVE
ncbi:hypothetical protein U9M48_026678 [Paspalum notatum var. saurae]|uniref:X8 domain-containing protein n=1 Tax=Paspalum notatum var. saurae TaxID=547442 RepID=A0AAQ3TSY7_PASNO